MSKFSLCRFGIHHRSLGEKNSITSLLYRYIVRYLDYCTDIMSSIRHDRKLILFYIMRMSHSRYILSK